MIKARLKFAIQVILLYMCLVEAKKCSYEKAVQTLQHPIYGFSVRLLDRLKTFYDGHFVYAPFATWIQMTGISQGALGKTLSELHEATFMNNKRKVKLICYRQQFRNILDHLKNDIEKFNRISLLVIEVLYDIKDKFKTDLERIDDIEVLEVDFSDKDDQIVSINNYINDKSNGVFDEVIDSSDLDRSILLMIDALKYKSDWVYPFNPSQTSKADFHNYEGVAIGEIEMMKQSNIFNYAKIPLLQVEVLELPCKNNVSFLIFLPIENKKLNSVKKNTIRDIFYKLKAYSLDRIFDSFDRKSVDVSLPKFEISATIDVRPLLMDMGIESLLYPEEANLKLISDYTMNLSLSAQQVSITVTEKNVEASSVPENIVSNDVGDIVEFNANKPFAFMIVDRSTNIILFAGMYSTPDSYLKR